MARALWFPSVLRAAGLTVHEVPGWQTRGSDSWTPSGIICHATAGSRSATDQAEINVLLNGSQTAPPPIAQLYLSRTGAWYVVASGRCNHALTGWGGPLSGLGNSRLLGIEAANDNRGEPWPTVQYESYARGVAALCRRLGIGTGKVAGHKEHQPPAAGHASIKTDPTFPMDPFRARVQQYIAGVPAGSEDDMANADDVASALAVGITSAGYYHATAPVAVRNAAGVGEAGLARASILAVQQHLDKQDAAIAELQARPAGGEVVITADLMKALGNQVLANIAPLLEDAVAAAVDQRVEAALRRVLGGLDGATPGA